MKLFISISVLMFAFVSEGFIQNVKLKNKLIHGCANSTDWSLPELYAPPSIIPLIPYKLARSVMLSKYSLSVFQDNDLLINHCEHFRRTLLDNINSKQFPKARYGLFGEDYLVGFIAVKQNNTNIVTIESILPLYTKSTYNISSMLKLFHIQYNGCIINTSSLPSYWKDIFYLYKCFSI